MRAPTFSTGIIHIIHQVLPFSVISFCYFGILILALGTRLIYKTIFLFSQLLSDNVIFYLFPIQSFGNEFIKAFISTFTSQQERNFFIFRPAFGCCSLQMLVKKCFFSCFSHKNRKKEREKKIESKLNTNMFCK